MRGNRRLKTDREYDNDNGRHEGTWSTEVHAFSGVSNKKYNDHLVIMMPVMTMTDRECMHILMR